MREMDPTHEDPSAGIRAISDEEVGHFQLNGWVTLEGLLPHSVLAALLDRAVARMGSDPLTVSRANPDERIANEYGYYERWDDCSHQDPWIRRLSHSRPLAGVAARLLGGPVRFYFDHVFVKRPAA